MEGTLVLGIALRDLDTTATSEGPSMGTVIWDKSLNKKLPNDQRAADLLI